MGRMVSVKGAATTALVAAFSIGSATLAPPANAEDLWAAIAFSVSTRVYGAVSGYPPQLGPDSEVALAAIQACANHPLHPTDCRFVVSGHCVALAVGPDTYKAGIGSTMDEAVNAAQFPGGFVYVQADGGRQGPPQATSGIAAPS